MQITFEVLGRKYSCNLAKPIDLSSPLGQAEREISAWYVNPVKKEAVKMGDWTGTVKSGASVNFYNILFNPHGNGTHTEGFGHISPGWESVNGQLKTFHFLAMLVHLPPVKIAGDWQVRLSDLQQKIKKWNFEALIVKTGQYPPGHDFSNSNPPYFEPGLLEFVREMGIEHFLTDLPSVDPEVDGGKLAAHKAFWHYPEAVRKSATISELLRIPEGVEEGLYLLNLQIAPFENDASPSRPVIYKVE